MSLPTNNLEIIRRVIEREGTEFTDNPADRGGPTKYGITLATLRRRRGAATAADVAALTEAEALQIYLEDFIIQPGFDMVPDPVLRWVIVDAGANHGPALARKLVQRALGVKDDGVWGPVTRQAIGQAAAKKLAVRVCTMRARLYAALTAGNLEDKDKDGVPDNLEMLKGWTDRAMDMVEELVATL